MNTYLGACTAFGPDDVDDDTVRNARITYLEGYLFDPPDAQDAFRHAARLAQEAGRTVALSLSDAFCDDRHRAAFRALAAGHVDILFANEDEIVSLYEAEGFEQAAEQAGREVELAVLTRGEKGSVVFRRGERTDIQPAAGHPGGQHRRRRRLCGGLPDPGWRWNCRWPNAAAWAASPRRR